MNGEKRKSLVNSEERVFVFEETLKYYYRKGHKVLFKYFFNSPLVFFVFFK